MSLTPVMTFKEGIDPTDMHGLDPKLLIIWGHFLMFANRNNLPVEVTNISHKFRFSKSSTHPEGRAIDISSRGWQQTDIDNVIEYVEKVAGHYGAYSIRDHRQRPVIHHELFQDGVSMGAHFHLQCHRGIQILNQDGE